MNIKEEKMNEVFTKHHLQGLPVGAVLHHFTSVVGENAHDHPFAFTSFIISGGYTEMVYYIKEKPYKVEKVFRAPGTSHRVEADTVHEIIDFPEGECWTLILPEQKIQEPSFYTFDEDGIYKKQWNEQEWTKIK